MQYDQITLLPEYEEMEEVERFHRLLRNVFMNISDPDCLFGLEVGILLSEGDFEYQVTRDS
tara:strand:- start:1219 stop:1401 length:183 start_codon:yes stop_codon:yes gene_type:complete